MRWNIMKKYFGKANIALIIAMMFILAFFGGEAMKTHTIDGSASNLYVGSALDKVENDYTVAEPEEAPNQELDISIEQSLNLTLGEWYSSDGKYANPTIPVYTIQKTRSDTENMVILICGEGYTKNQQQKFVNDVKKVWEGAMQHEPYRSYADRFNVYALCTVSESSFNSGGSTFFDVVIDKNSGPMIAISKSICKNHIFERCIGPAFLEQIHDVHIPKKVDPNSSYWVGNNSPLSEYEPFYYVHEYINQFAILVNTTQDFGGSHRNYERGIHYLVTPADSDRAQKTFTHELGHGLLELGDEYMSSTTQQTDLTSLNVAHTHDPNNVKWNQLLGFRKTYTCNALGYGNAYNSSYECLMRDTTYQFCEVCKLQGSKRMSQLIDGKSLYVAVPEVKKYTGQYSKPSDFIDTTYNGYYYFENYRKGVLLSGTDKNKFNTSMAGETIQLRTIVQNLSDTKQRYVTMKLWIKHADGSVATTTGGQRLEATQTFTIPVWSEKSKFWPKGALSYEGSHMNSGLENCELIYQIPSDAVLNNGDTVAFEVIDENGNILANDNTETQAYANINIEYKFEDGTLMPNVNQAMIPVAVGSRLNWTAPSTMFGHKFVRAEGHDQMVNGSGQTVTYYYKKQSNVHIHDWGEVIYTWISDNICKAERVCKHDSAHIESETITATGTVIKAATCTEKGKVKYTARFTNTAFGVQYREVDIDLVEHKFGEWIDEIPATTENFGTKGHKDCTVCKKHFDKDGNEITDLRIAKISTYTVTVKDGADETNTHYKSGDTVTIKVTIPTGKHFVKWSAVTGISLSASQLTQEEITFTMPDNDVTLIAELEDILYRVTVIGGTTTLNEAKYRENVTVTANTPEVGKEFDKWIVSGITLSNTNLKRTTLTFTMPENDVTFTATYKDIVYRVMVEEGKATPEMAIYQTEVTVMANEPAIDMYFDKWEVTGLDTTGMDLTKIQIKFQMPAGNVTFKATYLPHIKYGILVVDGTKDKSPVMAGEIVTITANPAKPGKVFDRWTCETVGVTIEFASATSKQTTFVMPAQDIKIKAHFKDIEVAPSVEIKVEGGTGAGTYKPGDSVIITANEPAEGKVFKCWKDEKGEIVSTDKSYAFTVNGETTLTAVYEDKASGGAIAGIVIGSILGVGIIGFVIFWFAVKKKDVF